MPGFDGTGPWGLGPRTGGGFGFCPPGVGPLPAGYGPGVVYGAGRGGIPWGGGRGRAFGGGRGWWWRAGFPYGVPPYEAAAPYPAAPYPAAPYPAAAPFDEKTFLENEITNLEQQLAAVKNRLAEIGTEPTEK
jgi:hypothetical protein